MTEMNGNSRGHLRHLFTHARPNPAATTRRPSTSGALLAAASEGEASAAGSLLQEGLGLSRSRFLHYKNRSRACSFGFLVCERMSDKGRLIGKRNIDGWCRCFLAIASGLCTDAVFHEVSAQKPALKASRDCCGSRCRALNQNRTRLSIRV